MPKAKLLEPVRDDPLASNLAYLINKKYGGSVLACAKAAEVDYNTLWRLTRGYHKPTRGMSQEMLLKLSTHFKISVDRMLKGQLNPDNVVRTPAEAAS